MCFLNILILLPLEVFLTFKFINKYVILIISVNSTSNRWNKLKMLKILLYLILFFGFFSEFFSYLLFEGLFTEFISYCGSACEIWPGIQTSIPCILVCIPRNPYYFLFFILGIILIVGSAIGLIVSSYRFQK